jgi:hypothetical protein
MGKKRKCYFSNTEKEKKAKLKYGNVIKLGPGMKGFLITYNCKFTFCLNEAKKLLQQFSTPIEVIFVFLIFIHYSTNCLFLKFIQSNFSRFKY